MAKYKSPEELIDENLNQDGETLQEPAPFEWLQSLGRSSKDERESIQHAKELEKYGTDPSNLYAMLNPAPVTADTKPSTNPALKDYLSKLTANSMSQPTSFNMMDEVKKPEAPAPLNPVVKSYLQRKLASTGTPSQAVDAPKTTPQATEAKSTNPMDAFSKVAEAKANQEYNDRTSGFNWQQALIGLGDAIAGRGPANSIQWGKDEDKRIYDQTVGKFQRDKQQAINDYGVNKQIQLDDPNSAQSRAVQNMAKKLFGDQFSDAELKSIPASMANDMIYKPAEFKAKIKEQAYNKAMQLEMMRQNQQDRRDRQSGDAYQKASHDLVTYRGNQAAQQAASALTNAQNALSLANKGKLSPDQLHLFASELAKLATGGVPGHSEIEALMPDTVKSRLAKFTSFFSNNPNDAEAQAFIDNNKQYLNELVQNYQGVLSRYKDDVLNGYKKKLSPEDYQDLNQRIHRNDIPAQEHQPKSTKVKVTNGKETLLIDSSDLENALADGYKQVN